MFYKSYLIIDKNSKTDLYIQIVDLVIKLIKAEVLISGQKILSSRVMAQTLNVHRKTVIKAYDELEAQGWIQIKPSSGTHIADSLPFIKPQNLQTMNKFKPEKAGFEFKNTPELYRPVLTAYNNLHLDDGFPDPRLAPLKSLALAYKHNLTTGNTYVKLGYGDTKGSLTLRKELALYLNETRGLHITSNNIIIVKGTTMAFYLAIKAFIAPNNNVIMGELNWSTAEIIIKDAGANVIHIPVDINGLVIDVLEQICLKTPIRMVYITSHHDYPTTVTLSIERRMKLLILAKTYGFIIFEDDYDYDFHYQSKPMIPLASIDNAGHVLYAGSFTKCISPALRVGYIVAPEEVIEHISYTRRIIDRQGDLLAENAIAQLLKDGEIQKHLRKSLRVYRERRDLFCELLKHHFNDIIDFQIPEGGMAVWAKFDININLITLAEKALKKGLFFSNGSHYKTKDPSTRLGFASSTLEELDTSVKILKSVL